MRQIEHELYETETMAELFARQGRLQEAVAIYRRLLDTHAGSERHIARWHDRLSNLEQAWGHAAGEEVEPDPIPLPRAPGVHVTANDDSVTVAWALPTGHPHPTLELFLIQRTQNNGLPNLPKLATRATTAIAVSQARPVRPSRAPDPAAPRASSRARPPT